MNYKTIKEAASLILMPKIKLTFTITTTIIMISMSIAFGNAFRISNDIINDQFVPSLLVNGKTVLRLYDKGNFISTFDRAQHIYRTLQSLEASGTDMNQIEIIKKSDQYSAYIQQTRLFQISPGDSIANDTTPENLVKEWAGNITAALDKQELNPVMDSPTQPVIKETKTAPDIAFNLPDSQTIETSLEGWRKMIEKLIKSPVHLWPKKEFPALKFLFVFIFFQVITVFTVIKLMNRQYLKREDNILESFARLDEMQNSVSFMMKEIEDLANRVYQTMDAKTTRTKRILDRADEQTRQIQNQIDQLNKIKVERPKQKKPTPEKEKTETAPQPESTPVSEEAKTPKPRYKHLEILQLKQQGKTELEIAKILNIGLGEVLFALNLRNKN